MDIVRASLIICENHRNSHLEINVYFHFYSSAFLTIKQRDFRWFEVHFFFFFLWLAVKSSILDKESVHRVVSLLLEAEAAVEETPGAISTRSALRIVDAFLMSKFCYDPIKKIFYE